MKDHAKEPAGESNVAEHDVVFTKRIICGYMIVDLRQTISMSEEIEKREQDREWLLDTKNAVERPFPMILNDGIHHRRVSGDSLVGDDMLACIIAIGWTCPEEKAEMESWCESH